MREARKGKPLYLPFRWELIEGRGFIAAAPASTGLARGDEIVAIDGRMLVRAGDGSERDLMVDRISFEEWSRKGGLEEAQSPKR